MTNAFEETWATGKNPPETLADKARRVFGNAIIDKRRLPESQLTSRSIPGYVAEWVLDYVVPGEGPLTAGEIAKVQEWAAQRAPGPTDANRLRDQLLRGEILKVLTFVQVDAILKASRQARIARLPMLGLDEAQIVDHLPERFPALLDEGMWGIAEILKNDQGAVVISFKPMQATISLEGWKAARREFSFHEWRDLLLTSMGYAPEVLSNEEKGYLLCRLLPLVQKNMHLMELAPKGTGKSYIYENISPQVRLIGGNVTPAKLFINNANGVAGYLARYKVVVLDEVQTLSFSQPDEIIANLKMYLANAQIQRGANTFGSDCGFVMLANITLDEQQNPLRQVLVEELPAFMQETAFLDRLSGLIPGWKIRKLSGDSFAKGPGLKSDFFGDTLLALRNDLALDAEATGRVAFVGRTFHRNEKSIRAIASGMLKLLYPHGEVSNEDFHRHCVMPAIRLRQHIWDQIYRLDNEVHSYERLLSKTVAPAKNGALDPAFSDSAPHAT